MLLTTFKEPADYFISRNIVLSHPHSVVFLREEWFCFLLLLVSTNTQHLQQSLGHELLQPNNYLWGFLQVMGAPWLLMLEFGHHLVLCHYVHILIKKHQSSQVLYQILEMACKGSYGNIWLPCLGILERFASPSCCGGPVLQVEMYFR